jgi:hypothetical protein
MEVGVRSEGGGIELATALGDGGAEFVERGEMPIDDRLIHQRPEMQHEDDAAGAPCTGLAREGGEQFGKEGLGEAAAEIPDDLAAGRLHEGGDVQPLVAVMAEGDRPLTNGRPDPAADRLQAKAVLVLCPDLDRPIGMRRLGRSDSGIEPPLKAACCSGVAARGCRGRGA